MQHRGTVPVGYSPTELSPVLNQIGKGRQEISAEPGNTRETLFKCTVSEQTRGRNPRAEQNRSYQLKGMRQARYLVRPRGMFHLEPEYNDAELNEGQKQPRCKSHIVNECESFSSQDIENGDNALKK